MGSGVQDLPFVFLVSIICCLPFFPVVAAAVSATGSEREATLKMFLITELLTCLLVASAFFYLAELAPHQGIVAAKVFSGKDPIVVVIWNIALELFRIFGCLGGVFLAYQAFHQKKVGAAYRHLIIPGAFCFMYGIMVPAAMSSLVAAIRDSFLL